MHLEPTQSDSNMNQMQQQINQLTQMMQMFVGSDKGLKSPEDHLAGMVISGLNLVQSNTTKFTWLVDTGATDHMCCSESLLTSL